jgi:hypothetical protein
MKTITTFTMAALATLVLATATDADTQDRQCQQGRGGVWVRAGTPCVFMGHYAEIIEPPHNGTAVLRADGSIYYSPKPGLIGGDFMRVQVTNKFACQLPEKLQERWNSPAAVPQCVEIRY